MELSLKTFLSSITGFTPETDLEKKLQDQSMPLNLYIGNHEAIQCFQDMKPNAVKYFDRNKIKQLIKYITEMPTKADDYDFGYSFPFKCCEMLKSAGKRIKDMIILTEADFNKEYGIDIKEDLNKAEPQKQDIKDLNICEQEEDKKESEEKEDNAIDDAALDKNIPKEKEMRKYNIDKRSEILDLFLDFLINEKARVNNVLCGYFYQVIMSLMEGYSIDLFLYLYFVRQDALEQLVMNSYKRSLSLLTVKILNIEDFYSKIKANEALNKGMIDMDLLESKKESFKKLRENLIQKLVASIDLNGMKNQKGEYIDRIDLQSLMGMLGEIAKIYLPIFTDNKIIVNHIFEILEENIFLEPDTNKRDIYNHFLIFLTYIICSASNKEKIEKKNYPEFFYEYIFDHIKDNNKLTFKEKLMIYIPKIILSYYKPISNFNSQLGIHIIYLIDLVIAYFNYSKDIPITFDFIILQSGFMDKSINYFFTYQLNNVFHTKFVKLFTLYLQDAENHPLLTDYFFTRKQFHIMLISFITKKTYKNLQGHEFINEFKYKSGKTQLSCMHIYVIDLIYKIQASFCDKLLEDKVKTTLGIKNYGFFEFTKDETSPKEVDKFKMPSYVKDIIFKSKEWDEGINNEIIPKIKKFEGKLLYTQEIKPKLIMSNNALDLKNVIGSMIANLISGKNNIVKKEEPTSNYNDINFWQVKNTISEEDKNKVNSNSKKNSNEAKNDIDDEDELLGIAMKLEKEEENKTKININIKKTITPKFNFIKKKEINISPTEIPFNTNKDKKIETNSYNKKIEIKINEEIKTTPELKNEAKKDEEIKNTPGLKNEVEKEGEIKTTPELKNDDKKEDDDKTESELKNDDKKEVDIKTDTELKNDDKKEDDIKTDTELKNTTKNNEEILNDSELKNEIKKELEIKTTPELKNDTKKEDEIKAIPELKNETKKEDEIKNDSEIKNDTQNKEEIKSDSKINNDTQNKDENKTDSDIKNDTQNKDENKTDSELKNDAKKEDENK